MSLPANIIANPAIVLRREFEHQGVLFNPENGMLFGLNRAGTRIWSLLDGRHTLQDMLSELAGDFDRISDRAEKEIEGFVQELVNRRLAGENTTDETFSADPRHQHPTGDRDGSKVMTTPRHVDVAITHRCNLRCQYCSFYSSAADAGQDLPLRDWLDFFSELNRCAVMRVTLQGGEPFYRKDLQDIIEGIVDNRMRFNILSNGTLITDRWGAFLAGTGRCDGVQVSIDGSVPATHDAFRGKGNFYKALRGIEYLKKYGLPVSVRVTVHRKNVNDLAGIARLLLDEIGLEEFSTNAASHMGLCRKNAEQVQLTAAEKSAAMASLLKLSESYPGRISAAAGPLADANRWSAMDAACRNGGPILSGGGYLSACNGTMETLAVGADGTILPCIQMPHIRLGRINSDDLASVWHRHPDLIRLRNRHHIPLTRFDFCRGCAYLSCCTGNCPALAYTLVGDDGHPSPDACLKRFLDSGGTLPQALPPDPAVCQPRG